MKTQDTKKHKTKPNIDDYAIKALDGTILPLRNIWQICHDAYGTEYILEPQIYALVSFDGPNAYKCFDAIPYEGDWADNFRFDKDKLRKFCVYGNNVYYKYILKEFNYNDLVNSDENEIGEKIMDKIVKAINEKIIKIIDKCEDTFDIQYQEWLKNNKDFLLKFLCECGLNNVISFPDVKVEKNPKTFIKF